MTNKGKIDLDKADVPQLLNMLEEIINHSLLGSTEEIALPEILKNLRRHFDEFNTKIPNQQKVIDFALSRLQKKDLIEITQQLI